MSRRPREAWGPARRTAFAVVPALFGALLLLAGSHPSGGNPSQRVHAAQLAPPAPALGDLTRTTAALAAPPPPTSAEVAGSSAEMAGSSAEMAGGPAGPVDAAAGGPAGEPLAAEVAAAAESTATTTPAAGPSATGATAGPGDPAAAAGTSSAAGTAASTSTTPPPSTAASTSTPPSTSTTTTAAPAPAGPDRLPSIEAELLPLTNTDRSGEGLGTLIRNACLDGVASGYAQQMARNGVLAHNPAAGSGVTGCRPGASWGDNVGTTGPCSASRLEDAFMASPSHRHNILTPGFTQVGFGAWEDAAGSCWVQVLFSS